MSELLLYSCVGSGESVSTETIFMSAHEENISAELQYLDYILIVWQHLIRVSRSTAVQLTDA